MTAVVLYDTTIRCDEPGCGRWFRLPADRHHTRRQAVAIEGWSHKGSPDDRDLCPDHTQGETDG